MSEATITESDRRFRIGERVRVVAHDGHAVVRIQTSACRAEIAMQGAQVLSWQPAGQADLLWRAALPAVGSGKAIRGGIPVCWPWFGPHPSDLAQPQHGLVRTLSWTLAEIAERDGDIHIAFDIEAYGAKLRLECVAGARLCVALTTRNIAAQPLVMTEALHTYFNVGDVGRVSVHGLDASTYRDNTDGGREKTWRGSGPIDRETIAVFERAPDTAQIEDPLLRRRIRISRAGGTSTVMWHPGANVAPLKDVQPGTERYFLCVESGNVWSSAVTVPVGAEHRLAVSYEIAPL